MRLSTDLLARVRASCRTQKSPVEPGMAVDTKRSCPRYRSYCFLLMRVRWHKSANSFWSMSLRWGGSSRVCRAVSMIQPRMSLRVLQLPSPWASFLRETASFLGSEDTSGRESTWSIAWNRCRRMAFIRFGPPWATWMKSSTKTSVWASGLEDMTLEGGERSSSLEGTGDLERASRSCWTRSRGQSSRGRGTVERRRSSRAAAAGSSL